MPKKLAQLVEAVAPKYLSMVKTPANRSGFKIIRSDEETSTEDFKPIRTRRKDSADGMLYISLPTDFTEDEANQVMSQFGLEEDYELSMEGGEVRLIRGDQIGVDIKETVAIRLDKKQDIVAHVAESTFSNTKALRADNKIAGAALAGIEFEGHSDLDVEKFLKSNNIEIEEKNIERIDDETYYVTYRKDDAGLHTDRVNLTDGVTARVFRADNNDLPESISRGIVEACYGNYGYGQLDFFAALTDEVYTDAAYDAVRTLGDILREITIWSGLNLSSRIDLMNNALSQYGFYMAELMNSLPRSVVSVMTSDISKTSEQEDITMAGETKKDETTAEANTEEVKRSDDVVEKKADEAVAEDAGKEVEAKRSDEPEADTKESKAEEPKEEMLKRSDVQAMIDTAVAAAVKAVRKDEEAEPETDKVEAKEVEGETAKREDNAIDKLTASVEALAGKVEEMGNTSTVRYDGATAATEDSGVYKGAIFRK